VAHLNRIRLHLHPRIEHRLPGRDVVLPLMPRTPQNPPLVPVPVFVDLRRQRRPHDLPQTDPRRLMRTRIPQRVEVPTHIDNPDLPPLDPHDLPPTRRNLLHPPDDVPTHLTNSARATARHRPPPHSPPSPAPASPPADPQPSQTDRHNPNPDTPRKTVTS